MAAHNASAQLSTEMVASGLSSPIFVTTPPGQTQPLFVVEQSGFIEIIRDGMMLPNPFLDIVDLVTAGGERGLLGMAFHPEYATNGFFFIYYTGDAGQSVLARYTVSTDPDLADPESGVIFFTTPQPFSNHNGGMLSFRPGDANNLYLSLGDGGAEGIENMAQNLTSPLGKILRIDVDQGAPAAPPTVNPNPFDDGAGTNEDLIWVYGLRNPWRFSFDRDTGDMFIGDVGESSMEEIDFQPASSPGGENYGWDLLEGTLDFTCAPDCTAARAATTLPIHEYGRSDGISVIGGYVYRGAAIPSLQGHYVFADFLGNVWTLTKDAKGISNLTDRTAEINPLGLLIASFGEDGDGELYIATLDGPGLIYKIIGPGAPEGTGEGMSEGAGEGAGEGSAEGSGETPPSKPAGCYTGAQTGSSSATPSIGDTLVLTITAGLLTFYYRRHPKTGT